MRATREDLLHAAERAIERNAALIYDVASESGQIVGNVRHMRWFVFAVAREIAARTRRYAHLQGEV